MKAVVRRLAEELPLAITEVDISSDPALEREYGEEIPVLFVGDRKAAKYRIAEDDLRKILRGRV
jgi:hypothetical protein